MIGVDVGVGEGLVFPLVRMEEVLGDEELTLLWVTVEGGREVIGGEAEEGVREGGEAFREGDVAVEEGGVVTLAEVGRRCRVCVGRGRLGVGVSFGGKGMSAGGVAVLGVREAGKEGAGVRGGGGEEEMGVRVGGFRVGFGVSLGGMGVPVALAEMRVVIEVRCWKLVPPLDSLLVPPCSGWVWEMRSLSILQGFSTLLGKTHKPNLRFT